MRRSAVSVNHEVPQMEEEGFDVNYFMVNGYGIPNYYEEVFLTNNDILENEPKWQKDLSAPARKALQISRLIRMDALRS